MFAKYLEGEHTIEELRSWVQKIIAEEGIKKGDERHAMLSVLWKEAKALIESQANDI